MKIRKAFGDGCWIVMVGKIFMRKSWPTSGQQKTGVTIS